MRTRSATLAAECRVITSRGSHELRACSGVAVLPVPIAHTGSGKDNSVELCMV